MDKLLAMGFPEALCVAAVRRFPRTADEVARIEYLLSGALDEPTHEGRKRVARRKLGKMPLALQRLFATLQVPSSSRSLRMCSFTT